MKKIRDIYTRLSKPAFWSCLVVSIGLLIGSWFTPPQGVIDSSVLAATGELFSFATLAVVADAIGKGSDVSIKKGDTEVTFNNPDEPKEEQKPDEIQPE